MKQKYAVVVLLALFMASGLASIGSFRSTEALIDNDMRQALALTLAEQKEQVVNADTVRNFNRHLQLEQLRGKAVLAVDTRRPDFHCYARCSAATVFALSEQRPALLLWLSAVMWGWCVIRWRRRHDHAFGGLRYSMADRQFIDGRGQTVRLTPMQRQLFEMFFRSPSHTLTKAEICQALWPKKDDASDTLYTLIRRLKPVVEQHSDLMIASDRGHAYELRVR